MLSAESRRSTAELSRAERKEGAALETTGLRCSYRGQLRQPVYLVHLKSLSPRAYLLLPPRLPAPSPSDVESRAELKPELVTYSSNAVRGPFRWQLRTVDVRF